jgi:Cu/Ag efflux protein CusF
MKKTLMTLMASLAAVALLAGAGLAQAPTGSTPSAPAPTTQAPAKAPMVKTVTGELVTMDKAAKTVTVKYLVDKKPSQMILSVDDAMLTALAQLKAGDQVKVTYEEMGGKFIAKTIAKA